MYNISLTLIFLYGSSLLPIHKIPFTFRIYKLKHPEEMPYEESSTLKINSESYVAQRFKHRTAIFPKIDTQRRVLRLSRRWRFISRSSVLWVHGVDLRNLDILPQQCTASQPKRWRYPATTLHGVATQKTSTLYPEIY